MRRDAYGRKGAKADAFNPTPKGKPEEPVPLGGSDQETEGGQVDRGAGLVPGPRALNQERHNALEYDQRGLREEAVQSERKFACDHGLGLERVLGNAGTERDISGSSTLSS
jgi:hypothetical protein